MSNNFDQMQAFIDYANHVKPYHTKILEVNTTMTCTDAVLGLINETFDYNIEYTRDMGGLIEPSNITVNERIKFIVE